MSAASKTSLRQKIQRRSLFLQKARCFFIERDVLEVDCPSLSLFPAVDAYIDSFNVNSKPQSYLSTSPEYCMKKLLSQGSGDIFQISHVFRDEPASPMHQPEFTMAEWYRTQMDYDQLIDETCSFILYLINKELPIVKKTYQELFLKYCQIDPLKALNTELYEFCKAKDLIPYSTNIDNLLDIILTSFIFPQIPKDQLLIIDQYPISQAALARVNTQNPLTAHRFEVFYNHVELANGYWELNDPQIQKERFAEENRKRVEANKNPYPIDQNFLKALENLPNCSGVAVGLDRVYMLACNAKSIQEELLFPFEHA